ncbi:MAG: response regulator transcription factor [Chloroflexi bacterium]|nr:response regulator transcription factor [Chloroflexota bacterium]
MQRVLLLSDDVANAAAAASALRQDGRGVRAETNAERFLLAAREWRPALVLVDLDIGLTAGGLAALLRDPVLADGVGVIAIASERRLELVGPGVKIDDFIVPPIDEVELRTRISRVLWVRTGTDDGHVLSEGTLTIDLERYKVSIDGEAVDLTYKEYELLRFLATNPGKPFTREALLNRVWGYDYYGGSRTVDVHVRRIRAKIERGQQFIETVRNVGYRFIERAR